MRDFDDVIADFRRRAEARPALVEAMVELTYGCNLRCVHCYNPTHQAVNEISTEVAKRILDGLAREGVLWVGFTGGELLTRGDSLEVVRYARSLGMMVSIISNATLVTEATAEQLRAVAPYQVDVSLYGATTATYEAVTRVPGSFAKFCEGLAHLVEAELPVLLKLVMMTLNAHELGAMREFAARRGVPSRVFTDIHPRVSGDRAPLQYRLTPAQRAAIAPSAEPVECGKAGALFDCLCGKSSAAVTPYGEMNLCTSIHAPRYDLQRGTVAQGWDALKAVVQQASPGADYECLACPMASGCERGTMDGWLEQGRWDGPCIPHFRETAELKAGSIRSETHGRK